MKRFAISLGAVLGLAGSARAEVAPDSAPAVGSWSVDLRFPWDLAASAGHTTIGVFGVGLGIDDHVTDRWSLGVAGEAMLATDIAGDAPPGSRVQMLLRLRAGVAASYVFHTGTSTIVPHCGPAFDVPSHAWLGARAGLETIDEAADVGQFAELSLGWDRQIGHTSVGPYVAVGVAMEPVQAYGAVTTSLPPGTAAAIAAEPASPVQATYATLGVRLVL